MAEFIEVYASQLSAGRACPVAGATARSAALRECHAARELQSAADMNHRTISLTIALAALGTIPAAADTTAGKDPQVTIPVAAFQIVSTEAKPRRLLEVKADGSVYLGAPSATERPFAKIAGGQIVEGKELRWSVEADGTVHDAKSPKAHLKFDSANRLVQKLAGEELTLSVDDAGAVKTNDGDGDQVKRNYKIVGMTPAARRSAVLLSQYVALLVPNK
jgi:hypothetical protein